MIESKKYQQLLRVIAMAITVVGLGFAQSQQDSGTIEIEGANNWESELASPQDIEESTTSVGPRIVVLSPESLWWDNLASLENFASSAEFVGPRIIQLMADNLWEAELIDKRALETFYLVPPDHELTDAVDKETELVLVNPTGSVRVYEISIAPVDKYVYAFIQGENAARSGTVVATFRVAANSQRRIPMVVASANAGNQAVRFDVRYYPEGEEDAIEILNVVQTFNFLQGSPDASSNPFDDWSSRLNTVIGIVSGLLAIAAAIWGLFLWRHRRRQNNL